MSLHTFLRKLDQRFDVKPVPRWGPFRNRAKKKHLPLSLSALCAQLVGQLRSVIPRTGIAQLDLGGTVAECMREADTTASVTTFADSVDSQLRAAIFAHLNRLRAANPSGTVTSGLINIFVFEGRPVRLIAQTGIWKPANLKAALTIRTTYTPPDALPPYVDTVGDDGGATVLCATSTGVQIRLSQTTVPFVRP